jgi:hypothetical protein
MVAAPYKNFQNNVSKWIYTVHTEELNNSVLIDSIVNLKRNKYNSRHRIFHLKNDSDSEKNWQFTMRWQKFDNMSMACFNYNHLE